MHSTLAGRADPLLPMAVVVMLRASQMCRAIHNDSEYQWAHKLQHRPLLRSLGPDVLRAMPVAPMVPIVVPGLCPLG